MELTIIIVNWNTRELLRNCLASIERLKGDLAVQTIVVDNNSADGSRDMVAAGFPGMLLMNSEAIWVSRKPTIWRFLMFRRRSCFISILIPRFVGRRCRTWWRS